MDYNKPDTSFASPDVSMQDLTLQTSIPKKLKGRYPLRERKQPQRFYYSYQDYIDANPKI